ncbi:MAG: hypothetical protein CMJ31_10080 [Phycisphaerae bacterium]|nr:hypothetical protein [Phycisphaerae bacterium]
MSNSPGMHAHNGHPLDDELDLTQPNGARQHVRPQEVMARDNTPHEYGAEVLVADTADAPPPPPHMRGGKIRVIGQGLEGNVAAPDSKWKRRPRASGVGAVHVKSFHCKLTGDSLEFLDQQINEWLDAHPDCEVKNVTTTVGEWTGKLREPALIVNIWV